MPRRNAALSVHAAAKPIPSHNSGRQDGDGGRPVGKMSGMITNISPNVSCQVQALNHATSPSWQGTRLNEHALDGVGPREAVESDK